MPDKVEVWGEVRSMNKDALAAQNALVDECSSELQLNLEAKRSASVPTFSQVFSSRLTARL